MMSAFLKILFFMLFASLPGKAQVDSLHNDSEDYRALGGFACQYLFYNNLLELDKSLFSYQILNGIRAYIPYGVVDNVMPHDWVYLVTDTTSFLVMNDQYGQQPLKIAKSNSYQCNDLKYSKRAFIRDWFYEQTVFMNETITVKDTDNNWKTAFQEIQSECEELIRPYDGEPFDLSKLFTHGQSSFDQVLYFRSGNGWNMYEIVKIGATDRALCECMLKGLNEESDKWKGFSQVSSFYWVF